MNVIIVGCGRVGGFLAGLLDKGGHSVTVVDTDRGAFVHLPAGAKVTTLLGDGTDMEVLRRAGIERADAFLALTQGDNRNLMSSQIVKEFFGVKRVIAKVNDPIRAELYRSRGIQTFSRTTILGTLLEALLLEHGEVGEILLERSLAHDRELSSLAATARAAP